MGCGASHSAGAKNRDKAPEEPELNGKTKFLGCPVFSEIVDKVKDERWFIIAFATHPQRGMAFAARNSATGQMLAKDVSDQELTKEKDEQSITHSWNLFFKGISSEIAKANKGGAKCEFLDGNNRLRVEVKISIAGVPQVKKADAYVADLTPVQANEMSLYRFIIEPIATYFCKKRTDLLDRPDPHKERQFGEQEAEFILKSQSIKASKLRLEELLPQVQPARDRMIAARDSALQKVARVAAMEQYVRQQSTNLEMFRFSFMDPSPDYGDAKSPSDVALVQIPTTYPRHVGPLTCCTHLEFSMVQQLSLEGEMPRSIVLLSRELQRRAESVSNTTNDARAWIGVPVTLLSEEASAESESDRNACKSILTYFSEADRWDVFSALKLHEITGGKSLVAMGLFVFARAGLSKAADLANSPSSNSLASEFLFQRVSMERLLRFLSAAACMMDLHHNEFHCSCRTADVLHAASYLLHAKQLVRILKPSNATLLAFLIAVVTHDLDHPGVNNTFLRNSNAFIHTLYSGQSPLERHHIACAFELLYSRNHGLFPNGNLSSGQRKMIVDAILATDWSRHVEALAEFKRRQSRVHLFEHNEEDQRAALVFLLKVADLAFVAKSDATYHDWSKRLHSEFYRQGDLERAKCGVVTSTFMDKTGGRVGTMREGQPSLIRYVVLPTFETFCASFRSVGQFLVDNATRNIRVIL